MQSRRAAVRPLVFIACFRHTIGVRTRSIKPTKDMRRGGLPAACDIHDNFNTRARATRADLVQYGSAAAAFYSARAGGGARGVPGAVPELHRRRSSPGAQDLRDLRTEGRGGHRLARDLRAS